MRLSISRKLISIIIITIIISSGTVITLIYQSNKSQAKSELEQLEFTMREFIITGAGSDELYVDGKLDISNVSDSGDLIGFTLSNLNLELYYDNNYLTTTNLSLDGLDSGLNNSPIDFSLIIPITDNEETRFDEFVSLVLSVEEFNIEFIGDLEYSIGGIKDNITFNNSIGFKLEQEAAVFNVNYIDVESENATIAEVELGIYNPYPVIMQLDGLIDLYAEVYNFGTIVIDSPILISNGWSNQSLTMSIVSEARIVLDKLLNEFSSNFTSHLDMTLTINDTTINLKTIFDLSSYASGSIFDIGIEEIKEFEINIQLGYLNATFDVGIDYNLPFQLNLSRITMNVTTTLDAYLGNVTWIGESSITLYPYEEILITDINILITNLNSQDIFFLAADSAVKIPIGIIYLEFFSITILVEFTIDRIEF